MAATPQIKELVRLPVASSWYQLGIQLDLSINDLKVIRRDYENEGVLACLTEMFHQWLKWEPTWKDLVNALVDLEEVKVAADICTNHGIPFKHSMPKELMVSIPTHNLKKFKLMTDTSGSSSSSDCTPSTNSDEYTDTEQRNEPERRNGESEDSTQELMDPTHRQLSKNSADKKAKYYFRKVMRRKAEQGKEIAEQKRVIDKKQKENEELTVRLRNVTAEFESERAKKQEENDTLTAELQKLKKEHLTHLEDKQTQIDVLRAEVQELKEHTADLEEKMKEKDEEYLTDMQLMKGQVTQRKNECKRLRNINSQAKDDIRDLKSQVTELESELADIMEWKISMLKLVKNMPC